MTLLAIDGGDKNVGYALFDQSTGEEIERGIIPFDDFFSKFEIANYDDGRGNRLMFDDYSHRIEQLVVEGYRHDPNVKQGGSVHGASQVEGAVKILGRVAEVRVTVQYAGQALPVAKQITGYIGDLTKTGNKKHLPDQDSAWLHGIFWLHCNDVDWRQWI